MKFLVDAQLFSLWKNNLELIVFLFEAHDLVELSNDDVIAL